jgi:hypothetical protein
MENRKNFWVNGTQGTKLTLETTWWELDGNPLGTQCEHFWNNKIPLDLAFRYKSISGYILCIG